MDPGQLNQQRKENPVEQGQRHTELRVGKEGMGNVHLGGLIHLLGRARVRVDALVTPGIG